MANLRTPLVVNGSESVVGDISDKLSENIDRLIEVIQSLGSYEARLGSKDDTRNMRTRMKEDIQEADDLSKECLSLLKELKDYQPKKADEKVIFGNYKKEELKNKILRRVQDTFNKENEKFTKILRSIKTKEKIYLESKKSMLHENKGKASNASDRSMGSNEEDPELYIIQNNQVNVNRMAQIEDLDFAEALLKEREPHLQDVRKLAHEVNRMAEFQAQKIHEASSDIEIIDGHTEFTVKKTEEATKNLEEAEKYQKKASKKNIIVCVVVVLVCVVVVAIVVSNLA